MKRHILCLLLTFIAISHRSFANSGPNQPLSDKTQQAIQSRMSILRAFKSMYEAKFFKKELFDIEKGFLQTSLSNEDKMPLNFFVEYNNMWWFSIIDKVIVPSIGYDYENDTGFIALEIYYDDSHILRGTQLIKFVGNKINYLRTYASPTFFSEDDVLIKLDNFGNQIWLETGYDLNYSANAALLFFKSPVGKSFVENTKTKSPIEKIERNLKGFLKVKS